MSCRRISGTVVVPWIDAARPHETGPLPAADRWRNADFAGRIGRSDRTAGPPALAPVPVGYRARGATVADAGATTPEREADARIETPTMIISERSDRGASRIVGIALRAAVRPPVQSLQPARSAARRAGIGRHRMVSRIRSSRKDQWRGDDDGSRPGRPARLAWSGTRCVGS